MPSRCHCASQGFVLRLSGHIWPPSAGLASGKGLYGRGGDFAPRSPSRKAWRRVICCSVAASGGLCESEQLQEIVGGADHGPLGTYFLDAAQQELAEAASLFDLSEHRLHHLLSQSVRRFEAAAAFPRMTLACLRLGHALASGLQGQDCPPLKTHQRLLKRDCGPNRRRVGQDRPAGGSSSDAASASFTLAVSLSALASCEQGLHR